MENNRILEQKEFKILEYELIRVCQNYDTQNYFWNLYHFAIKTGASCSFSDLIAYGLKKKIFPTEFISNDGQYFKKYLNF